MKEVAKENLMQLHDLLIKMSNDDYSKKLDVLMGSSIGEHMRHILEFYLLLISGSFSGTICYDKRERNPRIQNEVEFAIKTINKILIGIDTLAVQDLIRFEGDYTVEGIDNNNIISSVSRELSYCIEHSIHHQALIRSGLYALNKTHLTDEHFGVAYSTVRFRLRA